MKKLLLILLVVLGMQPAVAEDIQNMDTPVNWSYSAMFNTIMDLYKDDDSTYYSGYYIAERLFGLYFDENQAVSARWVCENYNMLAREEGLKVYNCYDVIAKMIDNHNKDILLDTMLKPIDKFQPEEKVYWSPSAIIEACLKASDAYQDQISKDMRDVLSGTAADDFGVDAGNSAFFRCRDLKYDRNLYTQPYSINELFEDCKVIVFQKVWGRTYENLCSTWIDDAINYHNEHVKDLQKISGDIK